MKVLPSGCASCKNSYTISIHGRGNNYGKRTNYSVMDIKRVEFEPGEEKEAIELFVKSNRDVLNDMKMYVSFKWNFTPQSLFKYFDEYLNTGTIGDVPVLPKIPFRRLGSGSREKSYVDYMRKRMPSQLEDPESILHDEEFLTAFGGY